MEQNCFPYLCYMLVVRNSLIPVKPYKAMNLFGVLFLRKEYDHADQRTIRHERIHTAQMLEMLVLPFYLWYVIEWVVRLLCRERFAYWNISFEREAYDNEDDLTYLDDVKSHTGEVVKKHTRRPYAWVKYLKNK